MADYLRKTLRGLNKLAADHRSGASQIAGQAVTLLVEFCQRVQPDDRRLPYALAELAEATRRVQPSMGPFLHLANRLQLAAEQEKVSLRRLAGELERFQRQRQRANANIARRFRRQLPRRTTVLTYSYSSTVAAALLAARRRIARVITSEGRPQLEGRALAWQLAQAGVAVTLATDAALPELVRKANMVVVGADAVTEKVCLNKAGTHALQRAARAAGKPFFVLADASKFLPSALARWLRIEEMPAEELWKDAPPAVRIVNRYFEYVPREKQMVLLCEEGRLARGRFPTGVKRQPVARRWQEVPAEGVRG